MRLKYPTNTDKLLRVSSPGLVVKVTLLNSGSPKSKQI
jgi:hypothetical protein